MDKSILKVSNTFAKYVLQYAKLLKMLFVLQIVFIRDLNK